MNPENQPPKNAVNAQNPSSQSTNNLASDLIDCLRVALGKIQADPIQHLTPAIFYSIFYSMLFWAMVSLVVTPLLAIPLALAMGFSTVFLGGIALEVWTAALDLREQRQTATLVQGMREQRPNVSETATPVQRGGSDQRLNGRGREETTGLDETSPIPTGLDGTSLTGETSSTTGLDKAPSK